MTGHAWSSEHRDALLTRVTVLTAGTAAVSAIGALGLGAGLQVGTHYRAAASTTPAGRSTTTTTTGQSAQQAAKAPAATQPRTVAPRDVKVAVLNGSGVAGAAHAAASQLTAAGFDVVAIGNAPAQVQASVIAYDTAQAAELQTLEKSTGVQGTPASGTNGVLVLVLGPDWTGTVRTVSGQSVHSTYTPPPAPPAPAPVSNGGGTVSSGGS